MIYISVNQDTNIITDNVIDYIPDNLSIYLDDVLVGTYPNTSTSVLYLEFEIPFADVVSFQLREYKMKVVNYYATIKEELVLVKDYLTRPTKEVTNTKQKKFYESE